ncbi:site-specific integrase, partial [bacterium]|nr:site-specific integrase [bacterium]
RSILNANRFETIYPLLVFVFNSGLRVGEIAGLCWDCINFDNRQILVKRNMTRKKTLKEYNKTKSIRYVPMNDQVYDVLRFLWTKQTSQKLVFAKPNGEPIDPDHYSNRQFKTALKLADIEPVNFHKTRHTYASQFMMNGGNIYDLQKILGHKDIKTTMKYAHLSPDHLLEASKIVNFKSDIEPELNVQSEKSYQTATEGLRLVK